MDYLRIASSTVLKPRLLIMITMVRFGYRKLNGMSANKSLNYHMVGNNQLQELRINLSTLGFGDMLIKTKY
jgi:hypothetical protein